jgi:hypothetical protein
MGGRGSVLCVNICVPSATLEKGKLVFNTNKGLLGLGKKLVDRKLSRIK